jgi:sugar phosphate permease
MPPRVTRLPTTSPNWHSRLRQAYHGWWILAAAVLGMTVGEGMVFSSFGLFVEPLEDEFAWARAEVALGFSVSLLVSGMVAPVVGRAADRFGVRRLVLLGTVLTGLSFLLLATVSNLWEWYVFLAINAAVRQMIAYIPFQVLMARWFVRRRATALSILGGGMSLGAVVMVPIMTVVIEAVEWEGAFVFAGIVVTLLFVPLALFVIRDQPPADADEVQPARTPNAAPADTTRGLSLGAALRTRMFWVLTLAITGFFYGVVGWMVHAVPYYESVGLSGAWAAGVVSLTSAGAIVAMLLYGRYANRFARVEGPSVVFSLLLGTAMIALLVGGGAIWSIALFIVLFLLGFAAGPLLEPLVLMRSFGLSSYGTILGASFTLQALGLVVAPTAAGAVYDATNSYDWALVMFAISAAISGVLFLLASRIAPPLDAIAPTALDS